MWRGRLRCARRPRSADGQRVVAAGGGDFYPGSRTASPSFSFAVADVRIAGDGDLLAQLDRLRRALHAEGLFAPQKQLARPDAAALHRGRHRRGGRAREDVLAGLRRRGWAGRLVGPSHRSRTATPPPAVTRALQYLAALEEVEVVIVARGGGSLADLFAFCDETLCRTVALLRVPVIASVGHHADRTLIDDVAAVSCSTPTHAAEAAVPVDCGGRASGCTGSRRAWSGRDGARSSSAARRSRDSRARRPTMSRAIAGGCTSSCASCAQARAAGSPASSVASARRRACWSARARRRLDASGAARELDRLRAWRSRAHDPQRTLERGYALVEDGSGEPVTSAAAAREQPRLTLRMADGALPVRPEP